MKLEISIPTEFVKEFENNKFQESFARVIADMGGLCGLYEKETMTMLMHAFQNAKEVEGE